MIGNFIVNKLKLVTAEPIILVYMMLLFLEGSALQELVYVKSCLTLNHVSNFTECGHGSKANNSHAVIVSTNWNKYLSLCLYSFSLFSSFYAGSWCDLLGRKVIMLIPLLGTALSAIINCLFSFFIYTNISYLFISSFISGITFGTSGIIPSTFGYISDITAQNTRTKRIVILEAMLICGGAVGKYLAGAFIKKDSYYEDRMLNGVAQAFLFEAVLATTTAMYVYCRIPRYSQNSHLISCRNLLSLRHVVNSVNTVFKPRKEGKNRKVLLILIIMFCINCGLVVQFNLGYYYTKEVLFWEMADYSNYGSIETAVKGGMVLIVLPLFLHFLHPDDYIVCAIGMLSRIAGLILFGLSTTPQMVYGCIALYTCSEFPLPTLRSLLSKYVDADERGKIFAFASMLDGIGWILGSVVLMTIFTHFTFRGLCFEVVAGLQTLSLCMIAYLFLTRKTVEEDYEVFVEEEEISSDVCIASPLEPTVN